MSRLPLLLYFSVGLLCLLSLFPWDSRLLSGKRHLSPQVPLAPPSRTVRKSDAVLARRYPRTSGGTTNTNSRTTPSPAVVVPVLSYPDANVTKTDFANRHDTDDRPFFILHMGPPKTATTTLQTELTDGANLLALDNYTYLGLKLMDPNNMWRQRPGHLLRQLRNKECQQAVYNARIQNLPTWPQCWQSFLRTLRQRRREGNHVILSDETLSMKYVFFGDDIGRTSVDWPALQMALEDQGWRPLVIVGYRRLYEIMPSAKQQWDRWTHPNNKGLDLWPPEGRTLQPLFPGVLQDPHLYDGYTPRFVPRTIQWSYTDHLIQMMSPYFEVRLLNMHDPLSIRSTLLCRVLPHAPRACRQSLLNDQAATETHKNSEQSLFYDAVTTAAAERGWFNASLFSRHAVHTAVRDYYEQDLGRHPMDMPLQCPTKAELSILLERSLVKERQILSPAVADSMKKPHVEGFWKAVAQKKFCWIDVNKTLEDAHWQQFFSELVPPLPNDTSVLHKDEVSDKVEEQR